MSSEAKPSKELLQFPSGGGSNDEGKNASPAELIVLARQAMEQKRLKQCMVLVKSILNAEPDNKEALALRSWIRSYLEQDLAKVRTMVEEARLKNQRRLFARSEIMLHTILEVDPDNDEAKSLLQLSAAPEALPAPASNQQPVRRTIGVSIPTIVQKRLPIVGLVMFLIILGGAGALWFATSTRSGNSPTASKSEEARATESPALPTKIESVPLSGSLALLVVPATGVQLSVNDGPLGAVPESLELKVGEHRLRFVADGYLPQTISEKVVGGERRTVAVLLKPAADDGSVRDTVRSTAPQPPSPQANLAQTKARNAVVAPRPTDRAPAPSNLPEAPKPVVTDTGTLALNAQLPVDVYMGDKYLGSTPLTLTLPTGLQTLEFRYQDIRKMVSFIVKRDETRREMVTFEVTVPINARPWAEVSVEGIQPRTLGQTPLGGVTLAVGSVLVFKNPNLPEKRYRVTGKETSIQVELR